ncbi:hypothetical protein QQF64_014039 [Cirrhinus molitorella]|uniref:Uncharacterized protein n=1 Tax=Cirrhinus molitorella TaxID=172907 RepID=A0ABR3LX21_9TELE
MLVICVPKQEEAVNHRVNTEMLKAFKRHKQECERDSSRFFSPSLLELKRQKTGEWDRKKITEGEDIRL